MGFVTPVGVEVDTLSGPVRGTLDGATNVWNAIPYAANPTGALRFRSPQPREPWTRALQRPADESVGIQPLRGNARKSDRGTLTLDVWTPQGGRIDKPVLVWLQGLAGLARRSRPLDGRVLAESGDVVVVIATVRLGASDGLDFTAFDTPEEKFDGNLAVRDAWQALDWVQANIGAFGGDSGLVTLGGDSAFAATVLSLHAHPDTERLFIRSIAQNIPTRVYRGQAEASAQSRMYLDILGCGPHDVEELRAASDTEREQAYRRLISAVPRAWADRAAGAPVVDGAVVPVSPVDALRAGTAIPRALLVGATRAPRMGRELVELVRLGGRALAGWMSVALAKSEWLAASDAVVERVGGRLSTGQILAADRAARGRWSEIGGAAHLASKEVAAAHCDNAPTWLYRFDSATLTQRILGLGPTWREAVHVLFDPPGVSRQKVVSSRVQRRWLGFVNNGAPQGSDCDLPWPVYTAQEPARLVIDRRDRVVTEPTAS